MGAGSGVCGMEGGGEGVGSGWGQRGGGEVLLSGCHSMEGR